jgi:Flp pilus assembly protein TadD
MAPSLLRILAFLLLFGGSNAALAQTPRTTQPSSAVNANKGRIRGRIVLPDGTAIAEPAKVTLKTNSESYSTTYTDSQGQFEIRDLSSGNYIVEVESDRLPKYEVASERVQVFKGAPAYVTITLKEKKSQDTNAPSGKSLSLGELGSDVPATAKKEYDLGVNASSKGKMDEAIARFSKAIALYPDYLMAHNDLGACYLQARRFDEAAAEFRRAEAIDSKAFNPQLNLGIVLVERHAYLEAVSVLEKALALQSDSASGLFYEGLAYMGARDLESAEKALKAAYDLDAAHFPLALFHLGQIYMNRGDRTAARQAFEQYLRSDPPPRNAAQVQRLIAILH